MECKFALYFFPRPMSTDIFCSRWNIVVIETSVWQMSYWWDELLNGNSTLSSLFLCSHHRKQSSNSTALHLCLRRERERHTHSHVCTDALFTLMSTRVSLSIWRVEILLNRFIHAVRRQRERERKNGEMNNLVIVALIGAVVQWAFFSSSANAAHHSRRRKENRVSPFCLRYYVRSSVLRLPNVNNIFIVGRNERRMMSSVRDERSSLNNQDKRSQCQQKNDDSSHCKQREREKM